MDPEPRLGTLPVIGQQVDRYTVVAEVGHGGMAAVYAARRSVGRFDKLFALKVMLPHLVSERQFVDMFLDESRIAAMVQHPNVVPVFDVGTLGSTPYMVMEYLRGQPLGRVLRRCWVGEPPSLEAEGLVAILVAAATGLHAAHTATDPDGQPLAIVHRDVSPQNIHVGYDGVVRLVDFGIAAAHGRTTQTRTGEVKGKLSYMAPEQLRPGTRADHRADLWSLGVLAWEAFARRRLFRSESDADTMWKVLNDEVPSLHELRPDLPLSLVDAVDACLRPDAADRPATALELAEALRASMPPWSAARLSEMMRDAFAEEREAERSRLASLTPGTPAAVTAPEPDERSEIRPTQTQTAPPSPAPARRASWTVAVAALGALTLAAVGVSMYVASPGQHERTPPSPPPASPDLPPESRVDHVTEEASAEQSSAEEASAPEATVEPPEATVEPTPTPPLPAEPDVSPVRRRGRGRRPAPATPEEPHDERDPALMEVPL